ncbi:diphthine synthase [Candidatus Woesearchaeota archaeon]|nr:diphthine synthase [Candidatus Woesearchaeota archaeon]
MTLYIIGLGLNDEKDITLKGLATIKKCRKVYLENYTSKLNCSVKKLEALYKKKIILADRDLVESQAEKTILKEAKKNDVAFLVVGDPFGATTHIDLVLRAKETKIKIKIIHNASILTAIGIIGLELYKYGKVTSIPFHNENVKTPVKVLKNNLANGLHTLFLLDLDPKQKKFLSINEAIEYLLKNNVHEDIVAIGCAKLGSDNPTIKIGRLKELKNLKFDKFPQCLIIPAKLHFMEEEALSLYKK